MFVIVQYPTVTTVFCRANGKIIRKKHEGARKTMWLHGRTLYGRQSGAIVEDTFGSVHVVAYSLIKEMK